MAASSWLFDAIAKAASRQTSNTFVSGRVTQRSVVTMKDRASVSERLLRQASRRVS